MIVFIKERTMLEVYALKSVKKIDTKNANNNYDFPVAPEARRLRGKKIIDKSTMLYAVPEIIKADHLRQRSAFLFGPNNFKYYL